jgi:hypothetical protein
MNDAWLSQNAYCVDMLERIEIMLSMIEPT